MQNKFFGSKLNSLLLLVLIILMVIAIRIMLRNEKEYFGVFGINVDSEKNQNKINDDWKKYPSNDTVGYRSCPAVTGHDSEQIDCLPEASLKKVLGNKDDLTSFSILPDSKVHGILSFRGTIEGAYFFEANIGINILDINKKTLKQSNAVAKSDWMSTEPVSFEGSIDFSGLPKGPAYFEIHNDNASGLPEKDKSILIPIIIN